MPRPLGSITVVSGILDHPLSRVMTGAQRLTVHDHRGIAAYIVA
jgi:hypothetical protein